MGRTQRALTSLVAAIPAGFLAYLLVRAFLDSADKLTTTTQVLVGVTLFCAALVTLMPFGLLIFGGKKSVPEEDAKPVSGASEVDDLDDAEAVDDVEDADADEAFDIDDSDADVMADSDADFSTDQASSLDEIETVDFDDEEEEEEPEPAPKKRKK